MAEGRRADCSKHLGKKEQASNLEITGLDYIVTGADLAPFIWEDSDEQETEGFIASSDHTPVMGRFDMANGD